MYDATESAKAWLCLQEVPYRGFKLVGLMLDSTLAKVALPR